MQKNNDKKVPQLRFPGFDGDWEVKMLGDVIDKLVTGKSVNSIPRPANINNKEYGILKTSAVVVNGFQPHENKVIEDLEELQKAKEHPTKDTILISRMNTPALVGQSSYISQDYKNLYLPDRLWKAVFKEPKTNDVRFIANVLKSPKIYYNIRFLATGTSNSMKNISKASFIKLNILLPTLSEQQKIANFLSSIDKKISLLEQKTEQLEAFKKGMMQQLFSQKLRFKEENGEDFPAWEIKQLKEITSFMKGKGIAKKDIAIDGKHPCIRYGELYTYYREVITTIKSYTNANDEKLIKSRYNDVIIPASGELAVDMATASCVLVDNVILGGDLNILRTTANGVFLAYYLSTAKKTTIAKLAQGVQVVHLYSSQLKQLEVFLPSLPEQKKIADCLSSIDQQIQGSRAQLEASKTYKKGLLQQLLV